MCKYYLNKARKYYSLSKQNKDGVFVDEKHRFVGTAELKDGTKLRIRLYNAYKPGGPSGTLPKNPNKYVIDIKEIKNGNR